MSKAERGLRRYSEGYSASRCTSFQLDGCYVGGGGGYGMYNQDVQLLFDGQPLMRKERTEAAAGSELCR